MKIWLDDVRTPPDEDWIWCDSTLQVIGYLQLQTPLARIELISLDHDLGPNHLNGYHALEWLEYELAIHGLKHVCHVPELRVHSANPVGAARMRKTIESIQRIAGDL